MERLRSAEKSAKEKRLHLYANATAPTTASNNVTTVNGQARAFDATVVRIWSGDQVSVVDASNKERRLQLSSTRGPKLVPLLEQILHCVDELPSCRLADPKQASYAIEAREFLRKKLIGKHVKVHVDFVRPREGEYEERECVTIRYGGHNALVNVHAISSIANICFRLETLLSN